MDADVCGEGIDDRYAPLKTLAADLRGLSRIELGCCAVVVETSIHTMQMAFGSVVSPSARAVQLVLIQFAISLVPLVNVPRVRGYKSFLLPMPAHRRLLMSPDF